MKKLVIGIIILALFAIGLSIYLIPSKEDIALIESKSNAPAEAKKYYEEQYEKGVRTPDIVSPLEQLEIQEGNIKEAIAIMEDYVKRHPEDIHGLQMLSSLYQEDQQYEKYYQTLLELYKHKLKLKERDDVLLALADYYAFINDREKLIPVLKELSKTKAADASTFRELANLYAEKKEYQKAYNILEKGKKKFPKEFALNDLLFEVWLLFQLGNKEQEKEALFILKDYLVKKNNPKLTYYVIGFFRDTYPQKLLALLEELKPLIRKNPFLESAALEILWEKTRNARDKERLFAKLLKRYARGPIYPSMQNLLFNIFLEKNYEFMLLDFIRRTPAQNLDEKSLANLVSWVLENKQFYLLYEMQKALGKSYLSEHLFIATILEIGMQKKGAREKLKKLLKDHFLTQEEKYLLFKLAIEAKYDEIALEIGAQLPPYFGLSESEIVNIAIAYIHMDKTEEFYELLNRSASRMGSKAEPIFALINAAFGNFEEVQAWLESQEKVSEEILANLFLIALEHKTYPFAFYVAERLDEEYPSLTSKTYYAIAQIHVGQIEEGLALLENLLEDHPTDKSLESFYFYALIDVVKEKPQYASRLLSFMEFRKAQGFMSHDLWRDFGYTYIEVLHDFPKAIEAFEILAKSAKTHNKDVETLVYLLGPKVSCQRIAWLAKRTEASSDEEFGLWLADIVFVGDFDLAIDLFERRFCKVDASALTSKAYFGYMDALVFKKRYCKLRKIIDVALNQFCSLNEIKKLSIYAEQAEHLAARRKIWEYVILEEPNDPIAWQELTRISFDMHDYRRTASAFSRFIELNCASNKPNPNLYQSFYAYAESLFFWRWYGPARKFYLLALGQILTACEKTPAMVGIESLILYRLADIYADCNFLYTYKLDKQMAAICIMEELYEITSRDPESASNVANMLMDAGLLKIARKFINCGMAY